ncbi:unnamed protein product [Triticum turgidum subsp. durum]|uniref:Uncharacterized protein n=1 Tax=Triticum turgidum subsp. durum TaxID=4567 RepID=A0A9R0QZZ0_TRITD|nr:unnamed protein product [Triticum turgidum subsp. durum]
MSLFRQSCISSGFSVCFVSLQCLASHQDLVCVSSVFSLSVFRFQCYIRYSISLPTQHFVKKSSLSSFFSYIFASSFCAAMFSFSRDDHMYVFYRVFI